MQSGRRSPPLRPVHAFGPDPCLLLHSGQNNQVSEIPARSLTVLFSPLTWAHIKSSFYLWHVSISSQKNTGSSWNCKDSEPLAKFSLAKQWQKLPVDPSFMCCFFWWELLFALRSSKPCSARIQHQIRIAVSRVRMWIRLWNSDQIIAKVVLLEILQLN